MKSLIILQCFILSWSIQLVPGQHVYTNVIFAVLDLLASIHENLGRLIFTRHTRPTLLTAVVFPVLSPFKFYCFEFFVSLLPYGVDINLVGCALISINAKLCSP